MYFLFWKQSASTSDYTFYVKQTFLENLAISYTTSSSTPRPYLTFIVGTEDSVLAEWQQYRPIGCIGSAKMAHTNCETRCARWIGVNKSILSFFITVSSSVFSCLRFLISETEKQLFTFHVFSCQMSLLLVKLSI